MTQVKRTTKESRASLVSSKYLRVALAGLFGTLLLLADPLDAIANQNLTVHMFQHIGLFFFSAVFGYGLERTLITRLNAIKQKTYIGWKIYTSLIKFNTRTKGLVFAAVIPAIVFPFWHYPANFDLAVKDGYVHIMEHLSYIICGGLVGASFLVIPHKLKAFLLIFAFLQAGMMASMMLVWPDFYSAYSAAQNLQMDTAMMLFGAFGMIATGSWFLKVLDVI